ncbi:DNA (cytosine-5-)-methyltransferase [Ferroacidibacillus organovorans]|uniref:DNA (cytosine-5-)-methyltransferase n=1 Tax=Ferroacidibacillus organovorans TaxID=1765683 RepID=A0A1V4EVM9_9BACL|nr:DNA (cytosine-5-)-methyltransferase [Ferroacidibacillus organovorans]OPG16979.1 hypothetical protein B2M26_03990 [Ferroacidibacillus organovorans]
MTLRFLDLFAGIGGMRRGLEDAGMQCVGYVERDKFARLSYEAIFQTKGEWFADDIQTVRADAMPDADIWTFGFPCQDLSVAGKHQGFGGERSSLFFHVLQLVRVRPETDRPEWLVAENVGGFLFSNRGYDFLAAQIALAEIGYDSEWEVCNATAFGIPQHRERVFLVGHARSCGRRTLFPLHIDRRDTPASTHPGASDPKVTSPIPGPPVIEPGASEFGEEFIASAVATPGFLRKHQRRRFKEPDQPMFTLTSMDTHGVLVTRRGRGQNAQFTLRDVATCLDASYHKGLDAHQVRTGVLVAASGWVQGEDGVLLREPRIRRLTPRECWRLMGRTDEEFDRAKAAHVSETQLYKQAGNSVVPQIVTALGQRIVEESHSSRL